MATILILGGLGGDGSRQLITRLVSSSSPLEPKFIRVVDKFLIIPQADASTTYLDQDTKAALKRSDLVEYMQANLLNTAMQKRAFTLPETHGGSSKSFDYVFDFSGESEFNLPDAVQVERTLNLVLSLGRTAVEHKVGVYSRVLPTQYKVVGDKKAKVGEEGKLSEPWGVRASWHHEAARGLASIEGLNLVLLRPAYFYGRYTLTGLTPRLLIGEVYRFLGEKLEFLWKDTLPLNTVSIDDFCSAAIAIAVWACEKGHDQVLSLAGEELHSSLKTNELIKSVPGAVKKEDKVRAAVFNIVDEGQITQGDVAKVVSETIGVEAGFHGSIISSFAKLNMGDVLEDVNEKHLEGWSELLQASHPPIATTVPISPFIPVDLLEPHPVNFSSSKLQKVVGWKATQNLDSAILKDTVKAFLDEKNWPNAEPKTKSKKK